MRLPRVGVLSAVVLAGLLGTGAPSWGQGTEHITVNAAEKGTPLPHFWEQMFGSGRAILTLRQSYRDDIKTVKAVTDFKYVRFHGIFHDEVGLFDLDKDGKPVYNFSYIDQIYDGLLENGLKPFVELSFTPKKMASDPAALHAFWYKQNVSPPKDYALWDDMITQFTRHLVERYGEAEVATWYFEVWNEPNIDFWVGKPAQATYFELYDHTARAIKKVDPALRVGGPSTAQAAWAGDFLAHCKANNVPVDFVSNHVYANDTANDVFKTDENIPRDRMVCRAVKKVHEEIAASAYPNLPFFLSEYNASYANEPNVTDSVYMGPWLADTIRQCDGMTTMMSYWSFSDVFEEQGVVKTPFYGGFGVVAVDGIPKPALNAFAMLHKLGTRRLPVDSESALATKTESGRVVMALWNYAAPDGTGDKYTPPATVGEGRRFEVEVRDSRATTATVWRLDRKHGNVVAAFDAMGRPPFPSRKQIAELRVAGKMAAAETVRVSHGKFSLMIPAQGLVVVELR